MRVRVAPWIATMFTTIGGAVIVTALLVGVLGDAEALAILVPGLILTLIGGLYFGPLPYFVMGESYVRYAIPVGLWAYGVRPGDRLYVDGDRLLLSRPRQPRIVVAHRRYAHAEDWGRMLTAMTRPRRPVRPRPASGHASESGRERGSAMLGE